MEMFSVCYMILPRDHILTQEQKLYCISFEITHVLVSMLILTSILLLCIVLVLSCQKKLHKNE